MKRTLYMRSLVVPSGIVSMTVWELTGRCGFSATDPVNDRLCSSFDVQSPLRRCGIGRQDLEFLEEYLRGQGMEYRIDLRTEDVYPRDYPGLDWSLNW